MMKYIAVRFVELFLPCALLSAAISALFCAPGLFTSISEFAAVFIIADIVFIAAEVYLLRRCFFLLRRSAAFFVVSYAAQALFAILNFLILHLIAPTPYTWIFGITKILSVTSAYNVSNMSSAAFFHLLLIFITALSPMGMDRAILDDEIRRSGGDFYRKKAYKNEHI